MAQKFPVEYSQMTPQQMMLKQAEALGIETADGDKDRVILVSQDVVLVVNRAGFDPHTWRKNLWRKSP
jgi:hypothetical protein